MVLSTILSLLTQISIQAIANAIDVPVWVERQTVDLKICMYDRLYQDTIIVNNRWVDNNLTPWLLEKQMNLLFSKPKILYLSIFFHRATTALRLKFEVCKELKNHLELLPKTGYIQAQSNFSAQMKFLPR